MKNGLSMSMWYANGLRECVQKSCWPFQMTWASCGHYVLGRMEESYIMNSFQRTYGLIQISAVPNWINWWKPLQKMTYRNGVWMKGCFIPLGQRQTSCFFNHSGKNIVTRLGCSIATIAAYSSDIAFQIICSDSCRIFLIIRRSLLWKTAKIISFPEKICEYAREIMQLLEKWQKIIENNGHYIID